MSTYFDWFNLPTTFAIDTQLLGQRYRQAQAQAHPDQASGDALDAVQRSGDLNTAYSTLSQPDRRAAYLLQLTRQDSGLEHSIADMDFLQQALELREQLDEARTSSQFDGLSGDVLQWLDALSREFEIDYRQQDWAEARDTARKLAFMQRLLDDIGRHQDRLDDDLEDWDSALS